MATVITWNSGATCFHKANAEKCYKEMGSKNITPAKVLEIAKDEDTELHKCFEWDDAVASEKYRLYQARHIIVSFVVREVEDKKPVGEPRRVFQISSEPHTYQPVQFFKNNEDEYNLLLKRAKEELKNFENRYRQITELEEVFEAIDKVV